MPRKCKNSPHLFCYICGSFTVKTQRRAITSDVKRIYQLYFGCPLGDQDKQVATVSNMHFMFKRLAKLVEQTNISNAFCCSHDMEGTKGSHSRLLFLPCKRERV